MTTFEATPHVGTALSYIDKKRVITFVLYCLRRLIFIKPDSAKHSSIAESVANEISMSGRADNA
jgi:hypothetical protein